MLNIWKMEKRRSKGAFNIKKMFLRPIWKIREPSVPLSSEAGWQEVSVTKKSTPRGARGRAGGGREARAQGQVGGLKDQLLLGQGKACYHFKMLSVLSWQQLSFMQTADPCLINRKETRRGEEEGEEKSRLAPRPA